jgi:rhomboid protease GluP
VRRENADLFSLAPVSMAIFAVNIILFVVCAIRAEDIMRFTSAVLLSLGSMKRELLWEGEWARLIMPGFLHTGLLHIIMNGWMLKSYAPAAEVHFGSSNVGTLYILTGVGGFCFSMFFGSNYSTSAGASASAFGLLGAQFVVTVLSRPIPKYAYRNAEVRLHFYWILAYFGLGVSGMMGNVDNWAHLGGFVLGVLLAAFFEMWRREKTLGAGLVLAMVLLIAGMVCAARWTVFEPYYHVHQALLAKEVRNEAAVGVHYKEAREWAKRWGKETNVNNAITMIEIGEWNLERSRTIGYALLDDWLKRTPILPQLQTVRDEKEEKEVETQQGP